MQIYVNNSIICISYNTQNMELIRGKLFKGTWDNVMILKNVFVSLAPEKEENLQLYFPTGKNCYRNCLKHWKTLRLERHNKYFIMNFLQRRQCLVSIPSPIQCWQPWLRGGCTYGKLALMIWLLPLREWKEFSWIKQSSRFCANQYTQWHV